jgi:hypothetical protein
MEQASRYEDLEALVLVHQDAELAEPKFCARIRRALGDPDVGVIGCVGAIDVRSIAWWEGSVTWASFTHKYDELGGGAIEAFSWKPNGGMPAYARTGEVDTVDGFMMVLSPWTVRNVRFDESIGKIHGYDLDFCLQVRAAGRKVVTEDLKVVHHHSLELVSDPEAWIDAHLKIAEKWDGRMPGIGLPNLGIAGQDWKRRARRAEAEAAAARLDAQSAKLQAEARRRQAEREIEVMTNSISWRLTHPLRRLNALRRRRKSARRPATAVPQQRHSPAGGPGR